MCVVGSLTNDGVSGPRGTYAAVGGGTRARYANCATAHNSRSSAARSRVLARRRVDVRGAPGPLLAREPVDEGRELFVVVVGHVW